MPKGPKGEKRPADVVGASAPAMKIATGEIEEEYDEDGKNKAAVALSQKGGRARAAKPTPGKRSEIARKAAAARWTKAPSASTDPGVCAGAHKRKVHG